MKENFELPEIFWIHSLNLEQSKIVAEWYNANHEKRFSHSLEGEYFHPNKFHYNMYGTSTKPNDSYPIITFQEFEKYILKKQQEEDYSYLIKLFKKLGIT